MKDEMTLREVCEIVAVSRRAIQGYEKAGLISASGKNKRGYLLYDLDSLERIRVIKLFQQLGFTIKEIKDIIDAPSHILKPVLEKRLEELKKERVHTEILIAKGYEFLEKL